VIIVALSSALSFAADAGTELNAMRKQDFVPPIYADGPRVDDAGFAEWFAKHPDVKVPFTIWRKPTRVGAVGVFTKLRFNDSALGISLDERLRQLCANEEPCRVWLSGRLGESAVFNVYAVHERVTGEGPHSAQFVRGDACLAIRTLKPLHCARGPARCEKCKVASTQPATPKLLDVCAWGDAARPTMELRRGGEKIFRPYDVLRSFADEAEARAFAQKHGLTDVAL
jgi:hypothetical protein